MARSLDHRLGALELDFASRLRPSTWPAFRAWFAPLLADPVGEELLAPLAEWSMNHRLGKANPPKRQIQAVIKKLCARREELVQAQSGRTNGKA